VTFAEHVGEAQGSFESCPAAASVSGSHDELPAKRGAHAERCRLDALHVDRVLDVRAASSGAPSLTGSEVRRQKLAAQVSNRDLPGRVLELVRDPGVRTVLLTGEPGAGKSYLLDAIAEELAAARVWGVRALSDVPLSALAHLVAPARSRIELIRELLGSVGPVVCIDDLDECDPLSQSLIERFSAEPGRTVIATVRTEGGRMPPAVEALVGRPSTRVVAVPALSEEEFAALVRGELGGEVETRLLDEVWRRSVGNPLFAVQVVRSARDSGAIGQRSGRWSIMTRLPVPLSLRQALAARLDGLPESARESAEFLAGLGRAPVGRFEASGRADALRALVDAGIAFVDDRGDGQGLAAGFLHPLFAEAVWERTDALRRRAVLAEHLAAERAEERPDPVRIAVLSLDLDGRVSTDEIMPALRLANGGFDAAVVLKFTTAAISRATGDDLEEAIRAEASALVQLGRTSEAFAVIQSALRRTRPSRISVRLALLLHELMVWAGGDQPGAARMLREQRRRYPGWVRLARAAFAVAEADGLVFAGRHAEATTLLDRDARPWRRMDPELRVARSTVRAHALAQSGRVAEALAELDGVDGDVAPVLGGLVRTLWGRPDDGGRIGREAYQVAADAGFVQGQAFAALATSVSLIHRGDMASVAEWAERSATAAEAAGMADVLRLGLLHAALSQAAATGAVDPDLLARLDAVTGGIGFFRHQVPLAHAWASVSSGDRSGADRIMTAALAEARADAAGTSEALLLHEWMRMGRTGLAAELAALPQGYPLMEARMIFARGLDAADPALLSDASEAFERLGMLLFAAEAAAEAARLAEGRASPRAHVLAAQIGSPQTPLLATLPRREALTDRELEVASLARERTSAQIAEALHLSVRTVENHLARAFRKLGISSRADLPADLVP